MASNPDPCVVVIFGASGDLTSRKLIPALFEMAQSDALPPQTCVLGVARTSMSDEKWRDELHPSVRKHAKGFDESAWRRFAKQLFYHAADATRIDDMAALGTRVAELSQASGCHGNILFYLSVAPSLYEPIIAAIDQAGLITEGRRWCSLNRDELPWQRIIVEKPFGIDLESAASLNRALGRVFDEEAVYRIDHYLGKELVQNLLILRFANTVFEPLWNYQYIDHVQITAAESVGVDTRAKFYDEAGAIRDMIQSHLLQVLALVAMEPPTSYTAEHIQQEKIKVVDAIRPTPLDRLNEFAALGQYAGEGKDPAYHLLPDVARSTTTETYAAIRFRFDNWRWAGTPFYLRTGKRMATKRTEVVIEFKQPAANLFRDLEPFRSGGKRPPNQIVVEIAPGEKISIRFEGKVPGSGVTLDSVRMEFDAIKRFHAEPVEAYGPLILDAMRGDQTLFKHRNEVEGAWRAVMPFIGPESAPLRRGIQANYAPGSWGPRSADELLARDGRRWRNIDGQEPRIAASAKS
jgi:glucose-6-phosphate 1-dehydrogenase